MLRVCTGLRDCRGYPKPGEIMELEDGDDGQDLIDNGYAEKVGPVAAAVRAVEKVADAIETAAAAPPENAAKRTTKPAPRRKS
jgi:hypothetical protein